MTAEQQRSLADEQEAAAEEAAELAVDAAVELPGVAEAVAGIVAGENAEEAPDVAMSPEEEAAIALEMAQLSYALDERSQTGVADSMGELLNGSGGAEREGGLFAQLKDAADQFLSAGGFFDGTADHEAKSTELAGLAVTREQGSSLFQG